MQWHNGSDINNIKCHNSWQPDANEHLTSKEKKKKKVPEYVFSLKYLVQYLKNSPAKMGSGVSNFGDLSPILPAQISSLFLAVIISVYDGEPLWYLKLCKYLPSLCLSG